MKRDVWQSREKGKERYNGQYIAKSWSYREISSKIQQVLQRYKTTTPIREIPMSKAAKHTDTYQKDMRMRAHTEGERERVRESLSTKNVTGKYVRPEA